LSLIVHTRCLYTIFASSSLLLAFVTTCQRSLSRSTCTQRAPKGRRGE